MNVSEELRKTINYGYRPPSDPLARLLMAALVVGGVAGLYLLSSVNFISYILVARLVTITVAFTIFSVGWNTRKYAVTPFYIALSACFLFVAFSDLLHLGLLASATHSAELENPSLTMNIRAVARLFEALAFPVATLLTLRGKPVKEEVLLTAGFALWSALLLVVASDLLPVSFVVGSGFAPYYRLFILLLTVLLAVSIILLEMNREAHGRGTRRQIEISIVLNVITNVLSLFFQDIEGGLYFFTLVLKLAAYLVLYRALVQDTLSAPYYSLFLNLTNSELKARRAKQEAEEASREKSEFIASVSHEIRTPMNAIIGLSNLMLSTELSHTQRRYAGLTRQSANALLTLINQILDYTKLEEHKMRLEPVVFDLQELVAGIVEMFALLNAGSAVAVTCEFEGMPAGPLRGDAQKLRQVLLNLISNAVKFTEKGSVTVRATAKLLDPGKVKVELTITDTGHGIPEAQLPKLFTPYEQGTGMNHARIAGTGLGLSISKAIVELLGGTISVASELGKGSVFCFNAYFEPAQGSVAPVKEEKRRPTGAPPDLTGLRVLVADDNEVNRLYATDLLTTLGFAVDAVADGRAVLAALETVSYDVVLMDVRMPGLSGFEATRKARAAGFVTPIIGFTADDSEETARECIASGMKTVLRKPFDEASFLSALNRTLIESPLGVRPKPVEPPEGGAQEMRQFAERYKHNPDKFKQIVGMFVEDCANHLADLDLASERGDRTVVGERAHALRGCFAVFGAQEAAQLTREVEELAAQGDLETAKKKIELLMTRMASMENYLKDRVAEALTESDNRKNHQQP